MDAMTATANAPINDNCTAAEIGAANKANPINSAIAISQAVLRLFKRIMVLAFQTLRAFGPPH